MTDDLDARLLAAHERDDRRALVDLYKEAADRSNDVDKTAFFLTHAYIFALEMGAPQSDLLHARLVEMGRDS